MSAAAFVADVNSCSAGAAGTAVKITALMTVLYMTLPLTASDSERISETVDALLATNTLAPLVVRREGAVPGTFVVRNYAALADGFVRFSPAAARWNHNTNSATGQPLPDEPGVTFE